MYPFVNIRKFMWNNLLTIFEYCVDAKGYFYSYLYYDYKLIFLKSLLN